MLFNSYGFIAFFVVIFAVYWALGRRWQNIWLLLVSYLFYAFFDWRFLSLIFITTLNDYLCSLGIAAAGDNRRRARLFVTISLVVNLSILGFFKYFNFFAANVTALIEKLGLEAHPQFIRVALPLGISFYTFKAITYTVDVYRGQMAARRNLLDVALYVAFFPNIVAGPIDRARTLIPQIEQPRRFTGQFFYEGCFLFFWGLFLKAFIADNLADIVNPVFAQKGNYDGLTVLLALYAYAFQIYCDFAGYSHMARGVGRMLGFDLMNNFNLPYFATNPSDFWRRWHISLSTWLRDYLYIPLGGNRSGTLGVYRNLMITMLLGGLWHGAAWTFVFWGAYQGALLVIHRMLKPFLDKIPMPRTGFAGGLWRIVLVIVFFQFTCLGWLLFRAVSMEQVWLMLHAMATDLVFTLDPATRTMLFRLLFFTWILILVQLYQYWRDDIFAIFRLHWSFKAVFYTVCFYLMLLFGVTGAAQFIYVNF